MLKHGTYVRERSGALNLHHSPVQWNDASYALEKHQERGASHGLYEWRQVYGDEAQAVYDWCRLQPGESIHYDETAPDEAAIMAQANLAWDDRPANLLEALEAFYMSGLVDQQCGDTNEAIAHYYRVARWIVQTDSQGFHEIFEYEDIAEAEKMFAEIEQSVYGEGDGND